MHSLLFPWVPPYPSLLLLFLLLLQYPLPFSSVWFCQHRRNRGVPGSEQSWWKQPKRKKFDPTAVGKAVTQALAWAPTPTEPHDRGTQACPRERTPFEVNQADKVFTTLPAQRQWPVTALHCCYSRGLPSQGVSHHLTRAVALGPTIFTARLLQ